MGMLKIKLLQKHQQVIQTENPHDFIPVPCSVGAKNPYFLNLRYDFFLFWWLEKRDKIAEITYNCHFHGCLVSKLGKLHKS